jgi:2-polyprenyl-6-methoxyphenol hydroxylase-like FAD-dependent oxidoreductase
MLCGSAQCLEKVVLQPRNAWLFHSSTTKYFDELEGLQQLVVVAIYLSNPNYFSEVIAVTMTTQITTSNEMHVLIIGAGITGLILAQALKQNGIRYTIFEKENSLNVRSNEWTMAIHWSLERLETLLPPAIYANMEKASCNPAVPIDAGGNYPIIHGETGNMLAGVPYKRGLRVPRSKMRKLCGEGIDIQYGKHLSDVEFGPDGNGVTATFTDGTSVSGNIIVGADGTRSRVREIALGSVEKAATTAFPIWHMNLTVCYGDAEKARYVRSEFPTSFLALSQRSFHAFQSISSMPDGPDHPESWIFHLAMAWRGEARHDLSYAERLAIIKEKAAGLAEPARSSFMWIPEGTQVHKADISYWVTEPWNNRQGRLTLVGDAAHPMPPCKYIREPLRFAVELINPFRPWTRPQSLHRGYLQPHGQY